ncbi:VOC family protein [Cellulomonas cellasea]|uniref:Glyoxalase n=2 Tax=Cellulomonas cellasea TaxID=43670 RepID=A0A0A0BCC8_9CELL|nr:VOC family protein [Cellulomonas cellasea]KGM03843.1 glyoxalase [Cellulomonas cellasea DSM 20118]GEA87265.1 glyoxalase [Cellulomonas cellasea]
MEPRPTALGLVVADMRASVAFYRRLGVAFPSDTDDHEEAQLSSWPRPMLDTESSLVTYVPGRRRPTGGSARASLAFELGTSAEVDTLHAELVATGVWSTVKPWDAVWGHRWASVVNPDGAC